MKNIILTPFLILVCTITFQSQTYSLKEVDKAPVIDDCKAIEGDIECFEESLKIHVQKTIDLRKLNVGENGKAYAQFEITEEGKIENVRVRSADKKLQKETKRIIEKLQIKEPAKKNGISVALLHTIPVTFNNLTFDSYSDFFEKEKVFSNGLGPSHSLKDAAQPLLFNECLSSNNFDCFENSAEQKIRSFVTSNAYMKELTKKGDILKIYFEVGANSEVNKPIVVFGNEKIRNALAKFLRTFKFEMPALDRENNPIPIYYQKNLVL